MNRVVRRALAAAAALAGTLSVAACEHSPPGAVRVTRLGPFDTAIPRRLTFSTLNDRTPFVVGDTIVYARQGTAYVDPSYSPLGREECLAWLPLEGGTILKQFCPHALLPAADPYVHTWSEPALSPDGSRIAFTWQVGPQVGPQYFLYAPLVVAPVGHPADTLVRRYVQYVDSGPPLRRSDLATRITWTDGNHLRFLATQEQIGLLDPPLPGRVTDTAYVPLALMQLDLVSGAMGVVPGGDSVVAYAAAPEGGIWVVLNGRPDELLLLDPTSGARTVVGHFSSAASDLIVLDGAPVAVVGGGAAIERLDIATGAWQDLTGFAGPVRHVAAAGGKRIVAEIEQGGQAFGAPSDLWLLEFP